MARLLTIACGDYDRTHAMVDGSVRPEGLNLNWLDLPHLEIWTRMLNYYDFDASEISLSSFTIGKTLGKPLVGIPIFPGRAFRHSYIFVNSNSGIREPQDLMGKKVGLGEFQQTATVWVRGILQHEYGVSLEKIGIEKNRHTLKTLIGYLYEQEMIEKEPAVEDLFAPNTFSLN